jgi:hypothetical protein
MDPHRPWDRRRHERVRLGGRALLLADPRRGLIGAKGQLIDLSEGGCRVQFQRHVDAHLAGRLRLKVGGKALWFPVQTRYVVRSGDVWTVGCAFRGLTTKKRDALRALLFELSLKRSTPSG